MSNGSSMRGIKQVLSYMVYAKLTANSQNKYQCSHNSKRVCTSTNISY